MTLEDKMLAAIKAGNEFDPLKALLISYGYCTEREIAKYASKISALSEVFGRCLREERPRGAVQTASVLRKFLWCNIGHRIYASFHGLRLGQERENREPAEEEETGECLRRTALYSFVGIKHKLKLSVLYNMGHTLSRLRAGNRIVDIENTGSIKFNVCAQHNPRIEYERLEEGPLIALAGLNYHNQGAIEHENKNWQKVIEFCGKAIIILPSLAISYRVRGEAKENLGMLKEALADYDKSIELYPEFANAYAYRGELRKRLGDKDGAWQDFRRLNQLHHLLMNRRSYALMHGF